MVHTGPQPGDRTAASNRPVLTLENLAYLMSAIFDAYAQEDQASSGSFRSIKSRTPADQNDVHDNDEGPLTLWCTMCHIINMTSFDYKPQSGQSIFDAVVFAAKRAFISGDYLPGQEFPSVRALAADLKIHPNTAHKIIQHLIHEGWLEARPGIGTVVCEPPQARPGEKAQLLGHEVEALVVGARRVGLTQAELLDAIVERWNQIDIARGTQK